MEFFYRALEQIGFYHPVHPPLAHMPTGLIVGAFIFLLTGWIINRKEMFRSAYHCLALALVFSVPTAVFGIFDWLHFYGGVWSFPIKAKIVLSVLLVIFLIAAVIVNRNPGGGVMSKSTVCFLCVLAVIGLGYFGGQLVFSETSPASGNVQQGENLYAANCAGCHPKGGNTINPALPVIGSPYLKNPDAFIKFNRNPVKRDGTKGAMPAFPKEKISDDDMKKIYDYVQAGLAKGK